MRYKSRKLPQLSAWLKYFGFVTVAGLWGCTTTGSENGGIAVTWTVNSSADTALCDANVGWVVAQVTDSAGNKYASGNAPCHSFTTSFGDVPSGNYGVSAYIFNADTGDTLATVSAHTVVVSNTTVTDPINFDIATSK